jgi:signal transduction histidine kinase
MVKNIMVALGGDVWFESRAGAGTVFYLRFNLSAS